MANPNSIAWLCVLVITLCSEPSKFGVADSAPPDVGNATLKDNFHDGRGYTGNGYVSSAGDSSGGRLELCGTDISTFLPPPYGNISGLSCTPLWNTFVLRYLQREDKVMTIILSAVYVTGWVGIGFSQDGRMVGSSAMVGWLTRRGHARVKQYYLQGTDPSQVVPDQGELELQKVPPVVVLHGAMIYMAFQVRFQTRLATQPILLAFSSTYPRKTSYLSLHDDKTTILIDFSKASFSIVDTASRQRRNHGILGIFAWGLILPLGAIFPRYMRHKDPLWYYLHVITQFLGFVIGFIAALLGIQLYNKIKVNAPTHRGIGIFLLVASNLQVLAFVLRPSNSKIRKYWNLYHHWIGRISLFFGALNIVLGIILTNSGSSWKIGYGFLVTVILVVVIVLEILLRMRSSEKKLPPSPSSFQMNPVE